MIYHFIFGLRAGSPPATASAAATGAACWTSWPSSTAALSFFSLSVSGIQSSFARRLVPREIVQTALQAVGDRQIHHPEIKRKQEHGDNHHRRRGLHFLARRRRHLLHLRAHIAVKRLDPFRPG